MKPPMGLVGCWKAGIVRLHPRLGDDGDALAVDLALEELVVECLLEHEPDAPLGVRHDQIQRRGMHLVAGQLVAAQDEADLGTVAVGQHHRPARFHHVGYPARRLAHGIPLVRHIRKTIVENQGIAADSDHGDLGIWFVNWHLTLIGS